MPLRDKTLYWVSPDSHWYTDPEFRVLSLDDSVRSQLVWAFQPDSELVKNERCNKFAQKVLTFFCRVHKNNPHHHPRSRRHTRFCGPIRPPI
jgi:hypothetical protein